MEVNVKEFLISDDKSKLQIDKICQLLNSTYWGENRPKNIIEKSIANSICFGIYYNGKQVGFARCVTDFSTVYYLADVVVEDNYRKLGLGKAMVGAIIKHEQLKGCKGMLYTLDAQGLYEQFDFQIIDGKFMHKLAN